MLLMPQETATSVAYSFKILYRMVSLMSVIIWWIHVFHQDPLTSSNSTFKKTQSLLSSASFSKIGPIYWLLLFQGHNILTFTPPTLFCCCEEMFSHLQPIPEQHFSIDMSIQPASLRLFFDLKPGDHAPEWTKTIGRAYYPLLLKNTGSLSQSFDFRNINTDSIRFSKQHGAPEFSGKVISNPNGFSIKVQTSQRKSVVDGSKVDVSRSFTLYWDKLVIAAENVGYKISSFSDRNRQGCYKSWQAILRSCYRCGSRWTYRCTSCPRKGNQTTIVNKTRTINLWHDT